MWIVIILYVSMEKTIKSFRDSLKGLKTVAREERNFKIEIVFACAVLFFIFYFEFTIIESLFLLTAILLVLTAEIINTAVEDLCDRVESNHDKVIGKIKDIMAAYVLVTVIGSIVIGLLVFYNHFLLS